MKYDLKNVTSISIERSDDNGTVTAIAYGRDPYCPSHIAVIKRASAKCGPNDIYDFNIGAKLAMDRLYEGYDMTPKPKRKPYNGIVHVVWDEDRFSTFKVVNGKFYNDIYDLRLPCQQKDTIYEDSSFEEMKQALLNSVSFIWNDGKPPMAICRDHVTIYL